MGSRWSAAPTGSATEVISHEGFSYRLVCVMVPGPGHSRVWDRTQTAPRVRRLQLSAVVCCSWSVTVTLLGSRAKCPGCARSCTVQVTSRDALSWWQTSRTCRGRDGNASGQLAEGSGTCNGSLICRPHRFPRVTHGWCGVGAVEKHFRSIFGKTPDQHTFRSAERCR